MGEELGLALGTLTGIVDRLAREGLVERHADASDRRVVLVRLTGKGNRLFEKIRRDRIEFLSGRLLDLDRKDVDDFARLLEEMGERLAGNAT